jgi:hypothetical protein
MQGATTKIIQEYFSSSINPYTIVMYLKQAKKPDFIISLNTVSGGI